MRKSVQVNTINFILLFKKAFRTPNSFVVSHSFSFRLAKYGCNQQSKKIAIHFLCLNSILRRKGKKTKYSSTRLETHSWNKAMAIWGTAALSYTYTDTLFLCTTNPGTPSNTIFDHIYLHLGAIFVSILCVMRYCKGVRVVLLFSNRISWLGRPGHFRAYGSLRSDGSIKKRSSTCSQTSDGVKLQEEVARSYNKQVQEEVTRSYNKQVLLVTSNY